MIHWKDVGCPLYIILLQFRGLPSIYDEHCQSGEIIKESPIFIANDSELAIDEVGMTRDMYLAIWEEAYSSLFDGATILIPLVHAQISRRIISLASESSSSYLTSFTYNYASWS